MELKGRLKLFHTMTLVIFLLLCYLNWSVYGKEETGVILVETPEGENVDGEDGIVSFEEGDAEIVDVFQPTNVWQVIKPGQSIPAGLHIRIDLSTGMKEAKLLDEEQETEDTPSDENAAEGGEDYQEVESTMKYWEDGDKEGISHSKQKYFTRDDLKDAMKLFKSNQDGVQDREKEIRQKFRSMEELKRDLEALNLNVETDVQVMTKLINLYNKTGASVKQRQTALNELEYYVHQIDNAKDLATIGGLQLIIDALNDTEELIRIEGAFVLGSAVQSNPHVQVLAVDSGALQSLLQLLSTSQSIHVRKKVIYAISALLRMFPYAQQKFLELGGLGTFSGFFSETDVSFVTLKVKALTLLHDILVEQKHSVEHDNPDDRMDQMRKEQYERIDLLPKMIAHGWCHLIPSLLNVPDNDVQEKVLLAMQFVADACNHFSQDKVVLEKLSKLKEDFDELHKVEQSDTEDTYYNDLSTLIGNIIYQISP